MRVSDAVKIEDGVVQEAAILSDMEGNVFLDFLKDTRVLNYEERGAYTGTVIPPEVVELPLQPPLPRMNDVLVFKLESSTGAELVFADKIQFMSAKSLYRLQRQNPEDFERTPRIKVYVPLPSTIEQASLWEFIPPHSWSERVPVRSAVDNPVDLEEESDEQSLWEEGTDYVRDFFDEEDEMEAENESLDASLRYEFRDEWESVWVRVGGRIEETDGDEKVFVAQIKNTGIYALFDERPDPTGVDPVDVDSIELAESPPYVDEFTDPDMNLNEFGLFDANSMDEYDSDINFEPAVSGDESVYASGDVVIPPTQSQNTNTTIPSSGFIPAMQPSAPLISPTSTTPMAAVPASDTIPPVQPSTGASFSDVQSPPTGPLIYASYVVCETQDIRLDTLPGAPNWQRPAFLSPQNQVPLTQDQINNIPDNCEIRIPQEVINQYQSNVQETGSPEDYTIDYARPPEEDIRPDMNDLQANSFSQELPKTGKKRDLQFPFSFVLAFVFVGMSVWFVFTSGKNARKKAE